MMNKTLITLLSLGCVSMAETLTFSEDAKKSDGNTNAAYVVTDGKAELTNGNIKVNWTEDYQTLSSWTLSFELLDSQLKTTVPNTANSGSYSDSVSVIFGTETSGNGGVS